MNKKNNKKDLKYILFITILYMFIFQNIIQEYISIFEYFDELFSIMFIPLFILFSNKSEINKSDFKIVVLLYLLTTVGIVSNLLYRYQSMEAVLKDILIVNKFIFSIYASKLLFKNFKLEKYNTKINRHCKIVIIIFSILAVLDYILDIFNTTQYGRYGLNSTYLFYTHPTYMVAVCIFILSIYILTARENKFNIYIFLDLILIIASLRSKAFGFVVMFICLYYYIIYRNKTIRISKLFLFSMIILFFTFDKISYYYLENDSFARTALFKTSLKIAKDYLPLGTGFATFGSYYSGFYYSPIYSLYKINNIYGIRPNFYSFIADSFWPMILGQFGIIGIILFIRILIIIFKKIQNFKYYKKYYLVGMTIFCYLLISSTSESAYANPIAIPLGFILGLIFREQRIHHKE